MTTSLERRNILYGNDVACYERMVEIREFEKITNAFFAAGSIRGTTHLAVGQEALALGIASTLKPTDVLAGTYRSHAIALALGLTPHSVLGEIMGKATGCCGGVGGSMHMCDTSVGLLPTSAIIGGGMPIAAGAALAFQVQKSKNVGVALRDEIPRSNFWYLVFFECGGFKSPPRPPGNAEERFKSLELRLAFWGGAGRESGRQTIQSEKDLTFWEGVVEGPIFRIRPFNLRKT
jgi:hypothetical protein